MESTWKFHVQIVIHINTTLSKMHVGYSAVGASVMGASVVGASVVGASVVGALVRRQRDTCMTISQSLHVQQIACVYMIRDIHIYIYRYASATVP